MLSRPPTDIKVCHSHWFVDFTSQEENLTQKYEYCQSEQLLINKKLFTNLAVYDHFICTLFVFESSAKSGLVNLLDSGPAASGIVL